MKSNEVPLVKSKKKLIISARKKCESTYNTINITVPINETNFAISLSSEWSLLPRMFEINDCFLFILIPLNQNVSSRLFYFDLAIV